MSDNLGWDDPEEVEMPEINIEVTKPREDYPPFINQGQLRAILKIGDGFTFKSASRKIEAYPENEYFTIEIPDGSLRTFGIKRKKLGLESSAWGNNSDDWIGKSVKYVGDFVNPKFPKKPSMNFEPVIEEAVREDE